MGEVLHNLDDNWRARYSSPFKNLARAEGIARTVECYSGKMSYSVPPAPKISAIAQVLPSENVKVAENIFTQGAIATPHRPSSTVFSFTQNQQASVAPDLSPLTAETSASSLGAAFSIAYPIHPVAVAENHSDNAGATFPLIAALPGARIPLVSPRVTRILTREKGGEVREFQLQPDPKADKTALQVQQQTPETQTPVQTVPPGTIGVVELNADRQEYDANRQVITAQGNVVLRFQQAVLSADRLEVNLQNRLAIAQDNVTLTRGQQVLRGNRFEYNFGQDSGVIFNASGQIYQPTLVSDLAAPIPTDVGAAIIPQAPIGDRLAANQPLQRVTNPGGVGIVVGDETNIPNQPSFQQGGTITQARFEAERVNFQGTNINATNVRITNDPFSPPELELRADTAQFRRISPLQDEIIANRPRLVLDQNLQIPLFQNRVVIDQRPRDPGLLNFGIDTNDRDGFFVERTFEIFNTPGVRFSLTPQYLVQRAIQEGKYINPDAFGARARLDATLSPRTTFTGIANFSGLDLNNLDDQLRANLRLQQIIGTTLPHNLSLQYNYRDRLFNGSLGFQTVQSSLGAVLTSPVISLGETGVNLSYQGSAQFINAQSDRLDLLGSDPTDDRISLSRYQASASVNRGFLLYQGEGLPATATEGLRYTPTPVVPYVQLATAVTGVTSAYSSGDSQNSLSASVGLLGQFGNFSRPFLDYTGFNITYSQIFPTGESPFLFDRIVDTKVLSAGINQQLYGPFRLGVQTSINLDNSRAISTDYFLEYSRRTYNVLLRYNPVLAIGSISFRLNDFNWTGNPAPFAGGDVRPVVQGVTR